MKHFSSMGLIIPALLFIVLSIPLILGKVPPNGAYGFRTPKTLSDPKIWYSANRFSGWTLLISGIITLAGFIFIYMNPYLLSEDSKNIVSFCFLVVPLTLAIVISFIYVSKL